MFFRKFAGFVPLFFVLSLTPVIDGSPAASYSVVQRWSVGGDGGWDQLASDPESRRLYVARNDRVVVIDTKTGKTVGTIPELRSVHYICLDASGTQGWLTDSEAKAVRVFDRHTLQIGASIGVPFSPNVAVFDDFTQSLVVFSESGNQAAVIDAASNAVLGTFSLSGRSVSAVVDGKGSLLVSLAGTNQIARVRISSREVESVWSVTPCVGPAGLAIDRTASRVYSACENAKVVTLDAVTGKLLATASVDEGVRALAIDPQRKLIFAANGGGTLQVIKQTTSGRLTILQKVKTETGARTLTFDPVSKRIYLPAAQYGLRTGETSEELRFRPTPVPGSFGILVVTD
jgi:DNA-binding beta-propeller fold protein YncE